MAHLLYFRGEGTKLLEGVEEYIVLVDAEELAEGEIKGHTAPGFELHSDIQIDEDISCLPCEETLIRRCQCPARIGI